MFNAEVLCTGAALTLLTQRGVLQRPQEKRRRRSALKLRRSSFLGPISAPFSPPLSAPLPFFFITVPHEPSRVCSCAGHRGEALEKPFYYFHLRLRAGGGSGVAAACGGRLARPNHSSLPSGEPRPTPQGDTSGVFLSCLRNLWARSYRRAPQTRTVSRGT